MQTRTSSLAGTIPRRPSVVDRSQEKELDFAKVTATDTFFPPSTHNLYSPVHAHPPPVADPQPNSDRVSSKATVVWQLPLTFSGSGPVVPDMFCNTGKAAVPLHRICSTNSATSLDGVNNTPLTHLCLGLYKIQCSSFLHLQHLVSCINSVQESPSQLS